MRQLKLGIGVADMKGDLYRLAKATAARVAPNGTAELLDLDRPGAVIPYDILTAADDEPADELLTLRMDTFADILGREGQLSLRMARMLRYLFALLMEFHFPFAMLDQLMEIEHAPRILAERAQDERLRGYFSGDFGSERSLTLPALRYRLDHLLQPEGVRLSLSAGRRLNFRRTMDSGGAILINLGGAGPRAGRSLQSLLVSDITHATFKRKSPEVRFPWFIDEAQVLFERPSDRENLQRMLTMSRSFGVSLVLLTQSLKTAVREPDFYQSLETNFRWLLLLRSGVSDAAIIRPALRATGMVQRGLDRTGRPAYLTAEQEIQNTLQEIANLPARRAYFWLRGTRMHAMEFKVRELKELADTPMENDSDRDTMRLARVRTQEARTKLAELLRFQPASGDVGAFLSRIERMRKET